MSHLPTPKPGAVFYETPRIYACLANNPLTPGHCVVVWKDQQSDLHCLDREEYQELMDTVQLIRSILIEILGVEKAYLMYMDEIKHVHWHIVPRYDAKGVNALAHTPGELRDTSLSKDIREAISNLGY